MEAGARTTTVNIGFKLQAIFVGGVRRFTGAHSTLHHRNAENGLLKKTPSIFFFAETFLLKTESSISRHSRLSLKRKHRVLMSLLYEGAVIAVMF